MGSSPMENFKILQWNCRSVRNKKDDLILMIEEYNPDVIALGETWLSEDESFSIPGYCTVRKDRRGGYGGVLLALRQTLNANQLSIRSNMEVAGASIEVNGGTFISIASIYIPSPPGTVLSPMALENVVQQLPEPRFLLGDFNAHGQQWGGVINDRRAQAIIPVFDDNNMVTLNSGEFTRIANPPTPCSALDLS